VDAAERVDARLTAVIHGTGSVHRAGEANSERSDGGHDNVEQAPSVWEDRTIVALASLLPPPDPDLLGVIEQVAVSFAHRFGPTDRAYVGLSEKPRWHVEVEEALGALRRAGLVEQGDPLTLTDAGRGSVEAARERLDAQPAGEPARTEPAEEAGRLVVPGVISSPLRQPESRDQLGFSSAADEPIPIMAELNVQYRLGTAAAFARLEALWARVTGQTERLPKRIAGRYVAGELTMDQVECLVAADAAPVRWPDRSIHLVWPDFPVHQHIDASCVTIKADAARKSFDAQGDGIVWAVVDSGIDGNHPHFAGNHTLDHESVKDLHRLFPVQGDPTPDGALEDASGHGTHVAGIIAGSIAPWLAEDEKRKVYATESRYNVENPTQPLRAPRDVPHPDQLAGMAPRARLVSLKVLGAGGSPQDRVHRVMQALAYIREVNGDGVDGMRIHGVNLSVGYEFDPEWFACGRSPLCQEVDRLVKSGVVVVVAAGNSGYGSLSVALAAPTKFGLGMTINDPGNSELAITVGSTHRTAPHAYGVSYFSSKGPTGDGRRKPDLVAPGERITSCAAGQNLTAVLGGQQAPDTAVYVEDSGTSMAAPHVSGAVAALLSVRREFIGQPERVKKVFVDAATDLGRGRTFQGNGLLDVMRALQKI
jgi:serine protease AprX